ncbi:MAG: tRNA (adenosine(37)-N6)-dimethylallyltransferase MiaA [Pseudanabaenaceae cyanobacterium bins.68]|nr:tRNA (adenosine(37)-N6)-dimethylallyltransferase MiaA [Pseudanabaenaceae cyanobacterium bins.68]
MSSSLSPGLIVLLGVTASGKTNLAVQLAQNLGLPILSADSRQVYRGMDIGTAKPSLAERSQVAHYLIDLVDLNSSFSLAEYQMAAQNLIQQFHTQGITPMLVGGTGMYIKAILHGMKIPQVAAQPELRRQLESLGQRHCHQLLTQVDPATNIHQHDQVRTIRALEIFLVTGTPPSALQQEHPPDYPILQIGLETPTNHRDLISDRLVQMLKQGWLSEIQALQQQYGADHPLLKTLGYGEMSAYLANQISLGQAQQATITHTLQFAKRQRTWFRNTGSQRYQIHWCDRTVSISSLLDLIHNRENWQVHPHNN